METWSRYLNIAAIGGEHGTPLQVISAAQIGKNFKAYQRLVARPDQIVFPLKANPSLTVLREVCKLGGSVACASTQEFYLARLAGFDFPQIHYNTPVPEMKRAVSFLAEGATVVVDSIEFLRRLSDAASPEKRNGALYVRINSNLPLTAEQCGGQHLPAHSDSGTAKFGVPSKELVDALKTIDIPVSGLHFHVGPQMQNSQAFIAIAGYLDELADRISAETGHTIDSINLGGGLGIPFSDDDEYPTVDQFVNALKPKLRQGRTYLVEPGRSLVGDAAGIVTQVIAVKTAGGRRWAVVDTGTRELDRIAMSKLSHQVLKEDGSRLAQEGDDTLGGALCFADDTLIPSTNLDGVKKGDFLLIQHTGAYCYHLARQFNGRPYQGAVKIHPGGAMEACTTPEEEVLNPTYTTFLWESDFDKWPEEKVIDPKLVGDLSSDYLHVQSVKDSYEKLETVQLSDNVLMMRLQVNAPVDFVSMPFCIRMAADCAIMGALLLQGVTKKSFPVWADRLYLDGSVNIEANREVPVLLSFSPLAGKGAVKVRIVRFSLDGGKFSGFIRLKFKVE